MGKIQSGSRGFNCGTNKQPPVFEVRLSRNDQNASPYQGENQCNAPIMRAMYKFLHFQSQA